MADNVAKYGFRFFRSRSGSGTPTPEERFLASAYQAAPGGTNVDINIGDPLTLVNDGSLAIATAGSSGRISHICVGVKQYYDGTRMRSGDRVPGGQGVYGTNLERQTLIYALRTEDVIWEIDCNDATTATTLAAYQAFINENADIAYSASSSTKLANPRLAISTHNTTATLQCRIVGISPTVNNQDFSGNYVKLLVTINMGAAGGWAATAMTAV